MPMPPTITYFDKLCKNAKSYLNIDISFDGYDKLIEEYQKVPIEDKNKNWELAKQLNVWSEYCSELANLIQEQYLNSETDKLQLQSQKSIDCNAKNVSAGERVANTDKDVIAARKKRNSLKSLFDALTARTQFLEKAFYQCKSSLNIITPGDKHDV